MIFVFVDNNWGLLSSSVFFLISGSLLLTSLLTSFTLMFLLFNAAAFLPTTLLSAGVATLEVHGVPSVSPPMLLCLSHAKTSSNFHCSVPSQSLSVCVFSEIFNVLDFS